LVLCLHGTFFGLKPTTGNEEALLPWWNTRHWLSRTIASYLSHSEILHPTDNSSQPDYYVCIFYRPRRSYAIPFLLQHNLFLAYVSPASVLYCHSAKVQKFTC
jgi:hypothetical protein